MITGRVVSGITEQAASSAPTECCGLLSGNGDLITQLHPLRNDANHPETRYFASPDDLLAAMRHIRDAGKQMMGIYHSHPTSPAYPSASDVQMAFYPDAIYFIASLKPALDIRAFTIVDGIVTEADFHIHKDSNESDLCLALTE